MRLVAISLAVLLAAPGLRAEQTTEDSTARRRLAGKGMKKITVGSVLLTAGAFVVPITSAASGRKGPGRLSAYR